MKKTLLLACCLMSLIACADDKRVIDFNALPKATQTLLNQVINPQDILLITQEGVANWTEYEVKMQDRSEWNFDAKGQLEKVEVPAGVPTTVVPAALTQYVNKVYPDATIVKYSKDRNDQELKLNNGIELEFDLQCKLLRTELD